ncbi:MAG: NGG1p interacting factor NIF3 [Candidatus Aureabacteria bacterium]|nr:NGG1p interacting factor NIF3 [Candidatus Auribacterota bacterium]
MKLKKIYEFAIEHGKKNDPRGLRRIESELSQLRKAYDDMPEKKKRFFDSEKLVNPFADTRILNGSGEENIKMVLAGIDIEVGEVLLADRMKEKGKRVDLLLSHHPEGKALAALADVMKLQTDVLLRCGVPISVSESLMEERMQEVNRRVMPVNHNRAVDVAKILDIPFLCVHTPADNSVTKYLGDLLEKKKPELVSDVIDILNDLPEYQHANEINAGPAIISGSESRRCGKIMVDMTGGTEGSKSIFENLKNSGVNTVVCMHLSEEHLKEAKTHHLNVIIAGHIASDNMGLNLFLDALVKKENINVIPCSGFVRVNRNG